MDHSQVLVLDFEDYLSGSFRLQNKFIEGIGQSLRQSGFVVCKNMQIGQVMQRVRIQEKLFFERLSLDEKLSLFRPETKGERGFVPIGGETAIGEKYPDLKEYFEFGREQDLQHEVNVWPTKELLPDFAPTMIEMYAMQEQRMHYILQAIWQYVGMEKDMLKSDTILGNSVMRLNFYPSQEYVLQVLRQYIEQPAKAQIKVELAQQMEAALCDTGLFPRSIRAGKHKDSNFITLLYEPGEGLQVSPHDDGTWEDIPYLKDSMVINIGEKLELKTGLPATMHRVINPSGNFSVSRYTEPFFGHPHRNCILDEKSGLVDHQYMNLLLAKRYTVVGN